MRYLVPPDLAPRMIAYRAARGLTQGQLAGRVGTTQNRVSVIESGIVRSIEARLLANFAEVLGPLDAVPVGRPAGRDGAARPVDGAEIALASFRIQRRVAEAAEEIQNALLRRIARVA